MAFAGGIAVASKKKEQSKNSNRKVLLFKLIATISIVSIAITLVVVSIFINNPIFDERLGFFVFFIAPGSIASLISIDIVDQNKLKENINKR